MTEEVYSQFAQISDLKKQITSLKIDLQKSSYQLEAEQQINRELSLANSQLNQKLKQTHQKMLSLQQRVNVMSENYEIQIEQLKILVDSRSQELQQLSRQILPKVDEDMLRIRLLNQLQIPHRQQLDQKERELNKSKNELLDIQRNNEVLQSKIQTIQQMKQIEIGDTRKQYTQNLIIYKTEIQVLSEQNIKQREYSNKQKKEIEELKQKLTILKQKYLNEIQELNKENNKVIMNYGSDFEVRSLKGEIDQKNTQIREEKQQILRIRKALETAKQQHTRLQYQYDQLKSQNGTLKELVDNFQMKDLELKLAAERQSSNELSIRSLRKEIGLKGQQNAILLQKIKLLQDSRGKGYRQFPTNQFSKQSQLNQLKHEKQVLQNKLKNKQIELEQLSSRFKSKENVPKKNARERSTSRSPDRNLKQKLNMANTKIVQLLKQKIALKQHIRKLSSY